MSYVITPHIFTALYGMQMRSSDENSVCSFVCLTNAIIVTKRKKNQCRFLHRTKEHLTLFGEKKEWFLGATPST